jgi:hypothetical protein
VSLGGGGGFEGFYGSVTAKGVSKVYASMSKHCDFKSSSFLVDIGGGLGRYGTPHLHSTSVPLGHELSTNSCSVLEPWNNMLLDRGIC